MKKQASFIAFPVHFGLGISFKAFGVNSCESFDSSTGGFMIPKWVPGLPALYLLKCFQQTKDMLRIQNQGIVYDKPSSSNNQRQCLIIFVSQLTSINLFNLHKNHVRQIFSLYFTGEETEAQRDEAMW